VLIWVLLVHLKWFLLLNLVMKFITANTVYAILTEIIVHFAVVHYQRRQSINLYVISF